MNNTWDIAISLIVFSALIIAILIINRLMYIRDVKVYPNISNVEINTMHKTLLNRLSTEHVDKLSNIHIYITTMPSFTSRIDYMEKQMRSIGYTNYEFLYGVGKNEINDDGIFYHTFPDGITRKCVYPKYERPVIVAHTISYVSHLMTFLMSNEDICLIMEDDASLARLPHWSKDLKTIIEESPEDTHIISLHKSIKGNKNKRYVRWGHASFSCVGWIFTRRGAKKILDLLLDDENKILNLNKLGPRIVIDNSFERILNIYIVNEWYILDWNDDEEMAPIINPGHIDFKSKLLFKPIYDAYNSIPA
jgi:hypothetical protein